MNKVSSRRYLIHRAVRPGLVELPGFAMRRLVRRVEAGKPYWSAVTSASSVELIGVTTLSNGTAVAVGDGGIESNATTAAPAAGVAKPASSVSGALPNDTLVPPTAALTTAVVAGILEDPSSTPGTNKNGLTS